MKRLPCILLLTISVTLAGPACAGDCRSLDDLRWLLGDWMAEGSASTFHESWTELGPRTFEGSGVERSKADGAVKGSEALRLVEMAGGVYYISKVAHNELPVAFRLSGCDDGRFVFENPAHDFPRLLEYRRAADDRLVVRVSDGGDKGFTLDFRRAAQTHGAADALRRGGRTRTAGCDAGAGCGARARQGVPVGSGSGSRCACPDQDSGRFRNSVISSNGNGLLIR
jgi:hypothetical protein